MEFIPNKYYKTKNGQRVRYIGETIYALPMIYNCIFEIESSNGSWDVLRYSRDGRLYADVESIQDIVGEW